MKVGEVARLLALSVRGIWRKVADGTLPAPVKIGKASRFVRGEIDSYLRKVMAEREGAR